MSSPSPHPSGLCQREGATYGQIHRHTAVEDPPGVRESPGELALEAEEAAGDQRQLSGLRSTPTATLRRPSRPAASRRPSRTDRDGRQGLSLEAICGATACRSAGVALGHGDGPLRVPGLRRRSQPLRSRLGECRRWRANDAAHIDIFVFRAPLAQQSRAFSWCAGRSRAGPQGYNPGTNKTPSRDCHRRGHGHQEIP